jgi:arginase
MQLAVIGVPYTLRGNHVISSLAWQTWRASGLVDLLAPYTERAVWVSLPEISNDLDPAARRLAALQRLRDTIRAVHAAGTVPLVLGGDSLLVGLGMLAGLQQSGENPALVWFDAHVPLGLHDALTIAIRPPKSPLAEELGICNPVPSWHILLAGIRAGGPSEGIAIEDTAMTVWDAGDLNEGGANELGRDMAGWPPIILQIDLSVLDPTIMPAVHQPAPEGLSLAALITSLEGVMAGGRVIAAGISNYQPEQDENELALFTSAKVVQETVRILTI